jgi:hypothetical protein
MHKIFEYTSQNFSNGNHFHLSRSSQRRFLANHTVRYIYYKDDFNVIILSKLHKNESKIAGLIFS